VKRHARFRADPSKVRVGVLRLGDRHWMVTIEPRDRSARTVYEHGNTPRKALARALRRAEKWQIPGLDLGMQWAYEHPYPDVSPDRDVLHCICASCQHLVKLSIAPDDPRALVGEYGPDYWQALRAAPDEA
jgi:hypothetical protein